MKYSELLDSGAAAGELHAFLIGSEAAPTIKRTPNNPRHAVKLASSSFASLVKMLPIDHLSERG